MHINVVARNRLRLNCMELEGAFKLLLEPFPGRD